MNATNAPTQAANQPEINSALSAAITGALGAAEELLDASRRTNPNDTDHLKLLARAQLNSGNDEVARQLCRQILDQDPHDTEARKLLGRCRFDLSEFCSTPPPAPVESEERPAALPDRAVEAEADFSEEILFWDTELTLNGSFASDMRKRALDPEKVFPTDINPYLEELRRNSGRTPRVLDAGSGPLSYLAWGHQQGKIELVAADPLAETYLELIRKHGLQPTAPLVKCFGEELSEVFGCESFDFIYMRNALDHSQSPAAVFRELVRVLRPGGFLFLVGTVREATRMNWAGLHHHDLFLAPGGRLMDDHRRTEGGAALITECISDGHPIEVVQSSEPTDISGQWIRVIWRKAAPKPTSGSRGLKPKKRLTKSRVRG